MKARLDSDPEFKAKHLEMVRVYDVKIRARSKTLVAAFRAAGCRLCPETTACCLVAHHVDPSTKEFNIGEAHWQKIGHVRIAQELAKCVCLCMNCHMKVHAGLLILDNIPIVCHVPVCGVEQ